MRSWRGRLEAGGSTYRGLLRWAHSHLPPAEISQLLDWCLKRKWGEYHVEGVEAGAGEGDNLGAGAWVIESVLPIAVQNNLAVRT